MSTKTTYQATCPATGETVTRTTAREYTAALAVNVPARPAYTIPAGTYWVTTGKRAHSLNRETGTRGYWNTISEDQYIPAQDAGVGIASFHADAKAAEKAGRTLASQNAKARQHTADTYGVNYDQGPVTYTVVETTAI